MSARAYAAIGGATGYRHYEAALRQEQRQRDTARTTWLACCATWGYIGAAITNGHGPAAEVRS